MTLDALERLFSGNPYTVQEIIPKEYLKNFDEVKHAVRAAEANTSGVNLEQNEEDNVQKSTVVDTSEEDRKPVNPFLNMTRQELLGLAMQRIREEMDQQDNPMDGAPVSVDTDEATSGSSCETQIPEAVIDGRIMPVGQPENTTEGVSASVDTEEVTPGSGCEMKNPEAVIDGEAMPVGQPENTMEGVPASVDTEEVTPGSGCEMKNPEAVIDGETMPVGQPENTMEGVVTIHGLTECGFRPL